MSSLVHSIRANHNSRFRKIRENSLHPYTASAVLALPPACFLDGRGAPTLFSVTQPSSSVEVVGFGIRAGQDVALVARGASFRLVSCAVEREPNEPASSAVEDTDWGEAGRITSVWRCAFYCFVAFVCSVYIGVRGRWRRAARENVETTPK